MAAGEYPMSDRRTFAIPEEPGPEVTRVRDSVGDLWFRVEGGWVCPSGQTEEAAEEAAAFGGVQSWHDALSFSPLTDETPAAVRHQPMRGSDVEAWIKRYRDRFAGGPSADHLYHLVDNLLDDYRLHADTGTPLGEDVQGPEGDV